MRRNRLYRCVSAHPEHSLVAESNAAPKKQGRRRRRRAILRRGWEKAVDLESFRSASP